MAFGLLIEVWGDYAMFTRPEFKSERYSYNIITPSAARGIVESIYWHPSIKVHIDKIYLLPGKQGITTEQRPFCFTECTRLMVNKRHKVSNIGNMTMQGKSPYISASDVRQICGSTMLRDVHYVIQAHYTMTDKLNPGDNPDKVSGKFAERLRKGQAYNQPYFGCREYEAHFAAWPRDKEIPVMDISKDLGMMFYDMDYTNHDNDKLHQMIFHAKINHGVMDTSEEKIIR